jgi:hypothetical protein
MGIASADVATRPAGMLPVAAERIPAPRPFWPAFTLRGSEGIGPGPTSQIGLRRFQWFLGLLRGSGLGRRIPPGFLPPSLTEGCLGSLVGSNALQEGPDVPPPTATTRSRVLVPGNPEPLPEFPVVPGQVGLQGLDLPPERLGIPVAPLLLRPADPPPEELDPVEQSPVFVRSSGSHSNSPPEMVCSSPSTSAPCVDAEATPTRNCARFARLGVAHARISWSNPSLVSPRKL